MRVGLPSGSEDRGALRVVGLLVVVAAAVALLETAHFALGASDRGQSFSLVVRFGLVNGALLLNAALAASAAIWVSVWGFSKLQHRPGARRLLLFAGWLTLAWACWGLAVRVLAGAGATRALGSNKMLATVAMTGALLAVIILAVSAWRRLNARRTAWGRGPVVAVAVTLFVAAVAADLANRRLYIGLYPELHTLLALITAVLTIAFAWWVGCLQNRRRETLIALGLVGLTAGVATGVYAHRALSEQQQLLGAIINEATIGREALSLAWAASDRDGDGYSPLFGGGDCNDADRTAHPGALEVAGNGVDEDCLGGDLPARTSNSRPEDAAPSPARSEVTPETLPDILIFSVDALRADRLPCVSPPNSNTPSMDRVVARGACFTNTYVSSTSSATSLPAIAAGSYFSNLYPSVKAGGSASPRELAPVPTLLNELASHGYRVVATVPTSFRAYFEEDGIEWSAPSGLSTPNLTALMHQIDEGRDAPLALWFHHMDAHLSYSLDFLREAHGAGPNAEVNQRYDTGVARVDRDLRTLLEWQLQRSRLDQTIVIITADHGEELSEHGGFGHARSLYEEVLRVPLIISLPHRARSIVDERVSIVDLAPTLRELVGIDPANDSDGVSLVPLLDGGTLSHPPVYAENFLSSKTRAVLWGDWKLIHSLQGNVYELYNLRDDPQERRNLVDSDPARLSAMQNLLARCAATGCRNLDPQLLENAEPAPTAR